MGLSLAQPSGIEARLNRLACVPTDVDGAIACLQAHLSRAWTSLGDGTLVRRAIDTAAPVFPCLPHPQPTSLDELTADLAACLACHHPAEIRVAAYTLLCSLVEHVRQESGEARVHALLQALEQS